MVSVERQTRRSTCLRTDRSQRGQMADLIIDFVRGCVLAFVVLAIVYCFTEIFCE